MLTFWIVMAIIVMIVIYLGYKLFTNKATLKLALFLASTVYALFVFLSVWYSSPEDMVYTKAAFVYLMIGVACIVLFSKSVRGINKYYMSTCSLLWMYVCLMAMLRHANSVYMYVLMFFFINGSVWCLLHKDTEWRKKCSERVKRIVRWIGAVCLGVLLATNILYGQSVNRVYTEVIAREEYADSIWKLGTILPPSSKLMVLEGVQLADTANYLHDCMYAVHDKKPLPEGQSKLWMESGIPSQYVLIGDAIKISEALVTWEEYPDAIRELVDVFTMKLNNITRSLVPLALLEAVGFMYLIHLLFALVFKILVRCFRKLRTRKEEIIMVGEVLK